MDLTHMTQPGAIGDLHFNVGAVTGWDRVWRALLPEESFRRFVARRIIRYGFIVEDRIVTFSMPGDSRVWRIVVGRTSAYPEPPRHDVRQVVPWRG
jgi:hypothetical protein